MVSSVFGGNAAGLTTALLKESAAKQTLDVILVKKARDVEKTQGEAALKLIQATGDVAGSDSVDIHV